MEEDHEEFNPRNIRDYCRTDQSRHHCNRNGVRWSKCFNNANNPGWSAAIPGASIRNHLGNWY